VTKPYLFIPNKDRYGYCQGCRSFDKLLSEIRPDVWRCGECGITGDQPRKETSQ